MTDFTEFVVQKFNGLAEKFAKKNGQYAVSTDPLANFSTGARLKYGKSGIPEMYETLKDYCRKHVAYVETHGIDGKTLQAVSYTHLLPTTRLPGRPESPGKQ